MRALVTGGAGFIGSNLVDRLLHLGNEVIVIDNFSTGRLEFLRSATTNKKFKIVEADLLDKKIISKTFESIDCVFHLAANADVRYGVDRPTVDLEQNTIVTSNVLEAMRINEVKKIVFSSTGSIYGDTSEIPTPENARFPIQTSMYGASKLACEGLISSYCEAYKIQSFIHRFVSILGERYTHGHVYDFYKKLNHNESELNVLGDGSQKKSYLYVQDCIDAILFSMGKANDQINIFNLGTAEFITVNESINIICNHLNLNPRLKYSGGDRGWIGDNPFIFLDTKKITNLGWKPKLSIKEGVIRTIKYLKQNDWVFGVRK